MFHATQRTSATLELLAHDPFQSPPRATARQLALEKHAVARLGGRAQEIINEQAVNKSDAVVAFFDSRLGTATGVDVSGTAEEINKAADAGKPIHVYSSQEDLPRDVETDQLEALKAFQNGLHDRVCSATTPAPQTWPTKSLAGSSWPRRMRAKNPRCGRPRPPGFDRLM